LEIQKLNKVSSSKLDKIIKSASFFPVSILLLNFFLFLNHLNNYFLNNYFYKHILIFFIFN